MTSSSVFSPDGTAASYRKRTIRSWPCSSTACGTTSIRGQWLGEQKGQYDHFPTWRTSQADVWDMRKRMQWCMTPLGTNMLAADAVEYAELELYLASFDVGKLVSVPGIRH